MTLLRDNLTFRSIGPRIALLIALILGGSTLVITLFSTHAVERAMLDSAEDSMGNVHQTISAILESEYRHVERYREQAMAMRREQMLNVTATVETALEQLYALEQAGQDGHAIRQQALEMLRSFRYFNNDYFFTYDREMTAIAHPDRSFEGRNLIDFQDPHGTYVLREIRDIALNQGAGYIDYWWVRLDQDEPAPKLGYVFHFEPWDWIIGSGVYIDDIEAEAERMRGVMRDNLQQLLTDVRFAGDGYFMILNPEAEVQVAPQDIHPTQLHSKASPEALIALHQQSRLDAEALSISHLDGWGFHISHFAPLDWYLVSAVSHEALQAPGEAIAWRQLALNGAVLLIGLLLAALFTMRIIARLRSLATHAQMFSSTEFRLAESELERLRELSSHRDEAGQLAGAFLGLERELQQYITHLTETTSAKERIESELRIAREIQMGILPKLFPAFPDYREFDIYASIEPAREVGGDLYDFFFVDPHHFCFVIGDVSGKGVPAAFFMAVTKTLLKAVAERGLAVGEILSRVNDDLASDNDSCMFVTLFCGVLDIRSGMISYASAGHNPPVLLRRGEAATFLPSPNEPVAGAMEGVAYSNHHIQLHPGDTLLLYTDGVTEAMDPQNCQYEEQRLLDTLNGIEGAIPQTVIDTTMASVNTFANGAEQSDDITMLALQFNRPASGE